MAGSTASSEQWRAGRYAERGGDSGTAATEQILGAVLPYEETEGFFDPEGAAHPGYGR